MVYQANSKLKGILNEFCKEYKQMAESSRTNYMKVLPPGAKVPEYGKIYQPETEAKLKECAAEYRAKADAILDDLLNDVHEGMTKAPTIDAANTISMLSGRENVTKNEIDHLVTTYGDNYQVYRAIQDIANKSGCKLSDHYLERQESELSDLKHNMDKNISYETVTRFGDSLDSFYSFLGIQIDQVVSD